MKDFYTYLYINDKVIDFLIKKSTNNNAFGGNCGIFAIDLAKFLKELNIKTINYTIYGNNFDSYKDFLYGEIDIYHVIVYAKNKNLDNFFDGEGIVYIEDLNSILSEYGHTIDTAISINLSPEDKKAERIILENTNHNIPLGTFYNQLKINFKKLNHQQ